MFQAELIGLFVALSAGRLDRCTLGLVKQAELDAGNIRVDRHLAAEGVKGLVIRPVGFVADHLEVLYDIDIEAQAVAAEVGIRLERARSMNVAMMMQIS